MAKHWFTDHPQEPEVPKFRFRIVGAYKDALSRQIKEAVRIQNRPGSLNSKNEYGGGSLTRLTVEKSSFDRKKEETKQRLEKEEIEWEKFLENKKLNTNI